MTSELHFAERLETAFAPAERALLIRRLRYEPTLWQALEDGAFFAAALAFAGSAPERAARFAGYLFAIFFHLYFNFSGYCDVVIGLGACSGFRLPENFRRPYTARNLLEFWERWHITFSAWLRDNIFNPLGMWLFLCALWQSALLVGCVSYLVTFIAAGWWHGDSANYLCFGLLMGVGVGGVKVFDVALRRRPEELRRRYLASPAVRVAAGALTIAYIAFGLLFFDHTPQQVFELLAASWPGGGYAG